MQPFRKMARENKPYFFWSFQSFQLFGSNGLFNPADLVELVHLALKNIAHGLGPVDLTNTAAFSLNSFVQVLEFVKLIIKVCAHGDLTTVGHRAHTRRSVHHRSEIVHSFGHNVTLTHRSTPMNSHSHRKTSENDIIVIVSDLASLVADQDLRRPLVRCQQLRLNSETPK
ncbi:hypothetical protein OGAPHI_006288 [Ogataea philodendri]|uniref:Uncharacterized protein n=1 Tax=Ogataea philodendri TaxID=1378263 RepID=A0A9P8NZ12_9ASCO|nr:uncharacterized protein OGAPHI_006288 [Ogataea philodendri]KAH3662107.1 hypothetical protein OGAPHI_006288 [Ogataea philodendri]